MECVYVHLRIVRCLATFVPFYISNACVCTEKPNPICVFSELLCSMISAKYAQGNTLQCE